MKDFIKYTLATVTGIVITFALLGIFALVGIIGMLASSQSSTSIGPNSVMVINLSGNIEEQAQENILQQLYGNNSQAEGLDEIVNAIHKAQKEECIKGIFINAGDVQAGYATMQEIRNALADFRKSGKWIAAYADTYTQPAYYVASVANHVWLNPKGMIDWHGIASQTTYLKELCAKFGIKYQVMKVGKYKSFTETYTESHMSDANRKQVTTFVNNIWNSILSSVSASRKVSTDSLNHYADRLIAFEPAENYKKYHLVDDFLYADEVKGKVKKLLSMDNDDTINQVSVADVNQISDETSSNCIAVYYASGSIVQDDNGMAWGGERQIVATDVCKDLEDLTNDDQVKAVVIRINSGGGDAYASEQLWHQIAEMKKKKPVVISMGDYAASGAYYMSCPASWIVAQPNTLTGSIGIFAVFPDASELVTQKLGVSFDEVKTNTNSSFGSFYKRPLNTDETRILQGYINRGYDLFRQRVANGRKQSVATIESIAQGRVWAGTDALKIHLVDELGGLDTALKKAATLARLDSYTTASYPIPSGWQEQLLDLGKKRNILDEKLRLALGTLYEPMMLIQHTSKQAMLQARIPYIIDIH